MRDSKFTPATIYLHYNKYNNPSTDIYHQISLFRFIILRPMPLNSRLILQKLIQFVSALHILDVSLLDSVLLQIGKKSINCLHSNSQCWNWINNAVVAVFFECSNIDVRCFSELCHVCEQENIFFMRFQLFCNSFEFFLSLQTLWEDHIGSCIDVSFGSIDRFIQSKHTLCISPRANNEFAIWNFDTCLSCYFYFIDHLTCRNQLFAI